MRRQDKALQRNQNHQPMGCISATNWASREPKNFISAYLREHLLQRAVDGSETHTLRQELPKSDREIESSLSEIKQNVKNTRPCAVLNGRGRGDQKREGGGERETEPRSTRIRGSDWAGTDPRISPRREPSSSSNPPPVSARRTGVPTT